VYVQPGSYGGSYDEGPASGLLLHCPICDPSNAALARTIGSGSFAFRCDFGHVFTLNQFYQPPPQLSPVRGEPLFAFRFEV